MEDEKIDGWSEDVQEALDYTFNDLESTMYEIKCCKRGVCTQAHNNEQLAEYLKNIAEALLEAAEDIASFPNDMYDEGDDE